MRTVDDPPDEGKGPSDIDAEGALDALEVVAGMFREDPLRGRLMAFMLARARRFPGLAGVMVRGHGKPPGGQLIALPHMMAPLRAPLPVAALLTDGAPMRAWLAARDLDQAARDLLDPTLDPAQRTALEAVVDGAWEATNHGGYGPTMRTTLVATLDQVATLPGNVASRAEAVAVCFGLVYPAAGLALRPELLREAVEAWTRADPADGGRSKWDVVADLCRDANAALAGRARSGGPSTSPETVRREYRRWRELRRLRRGRRR
jgi:hypothetical protein